MWNCLFSCTLEVFVVKVFWTTMCMQVLAHPEVQIGFHPDAGASYYLSRLPGYLGELHLWLICSLYPCSMHKCIVKWWSNSRSECDWPTNTLTSMFWCFWSDFCVFLFRGILGSNRAEAKWCRNDSMWPCHPLLLKRGLIQLPCFIFVLSS